VKILHIITSLEQGGAQQLLLRLVRANNIGASGDKHVVFSLTEHDTCCRELLACGADVFINKTGGMVKGIYLLNHLYLRERPDVVHTWLYHSDLIGLLLSVIYNSHALVWGLHHADPKHNKLLVRLYTRICGLLSGYVPDAIVACSGLVMKNHINSGYSGNNMLVIENGIDFNVYVNKTKSESDYSLKKGMIIITHIARWHPLKGHRYFIEMAARLHEMDDRYVFIMVGTLVDSENKQLMRLLDGAGISEVTYLLGERSDIVDILNVSDIYVSSSISESFSLTLLEAIACRVVSISTNTGIADVALSDSRCIVDKEQVGEAVNAVLELTSLDRSEILEIINKSYDRVEDRFSEAIMIESYNELYKNVANMLEHQL